MTAVNTRFSKTNGNMFFASPEHAKFEDFVNLKFPWMNPVTKIEGEVKNVFDGKSLLTLDNGMRLTFGQIIALAGDYYGIAEKPVVDPSQGRNHVDYGRRERFQAAYETLRKAPEKEMEKLLKMLEDDSREEKPNDGRERSGKCFHSDREWNEAVGGKWALGLPLKPGQMLKLAENNYDHFQPNAKETYVIGHQLAVEKAREAANSDKLHREKLLCEAYSIDAFACHFLTDCFASGHIRTPRVELGKNITPANIGHLLSKYMHDKDNKFGLRVTNVRGDKWISYGDGMLLERNDEKNLHLAVEAVQKSVDQVYEAYQNSKATLSSTAVTDLIPFVDEGEKNNSPLFKVKGGRLHRRSDINDFQDQKTVTNWWGTTTAALLLRHKPGNSAIQKNTLVK